MVFAGQDITGVPEERLGWLRKRTAIVFQDPFSSLNPYMTVAELIAAVPEPDPANRFRRRASDRWQDVPGAAIHADCAHGGSAAEPASLLDVPGEPGLLVACHVELTRAR